MVRPHLPEDVVRSERLIVRLTRAEKLEIYAAAKAAGEDASAYCRRIILRAARRR